jgi:asparagine synthase (glutamine-hydrolysing)
MSTVKEILLDEASEFSVVFNQKYISEILEQHSNGYNKEKQIFLLLSIYYWFDSNKKVTQK